MTRPRCGREMTAYEASNGPLLDAPLCGRPEHHNGQCRSMQSLARARAKATVRMRAWKRERRILVRQAARRAVLAAELREFDGYKAARHRDELTAELRRAA